VRACAAKVELFISALPDGVDQPVLRTPVTRVPCGVEAAAAELERYNEEASALAQSIAASCAGCGMQLSTCVPPRRPQPLPVRVGADRSASFVRSRADTLGRAPMHADYRRVVPCCTVRAGMRAGMHTRCTCARTGVAASSGCCNRPAPTRRRSAELGSCQRACRSVAPVALAGFTEAETGDILPALGLAQGLTAQDRSRPNGASRWRPCH
jgi:hypothetical protein